MLYFNGVPGDVWLRKNGSADGAEGNVLIGFDGAPGGGKTTLVGGVSEVLRSEGFSVGVVTEVVRTVFKDFEKEGFRSLEEIRNSPKIAEFQSEILTRQYTLENSMLKKYQIVLSDRTLFGNQYFAIRYVRDREALNNYMRKLKTYLDRRSSWLGKIYDVVLIVPPLPDHIDVDDGFRTKDLGDRTAQSFVIKQLAKAYVNRVYELKTVDLDERIEFVRGLVGMLVSERVIA